MEEIKCSRCRNRIGNLCKELDQRLELVSVEKELEFDQPEECKGVTKNENRN
ncbi:hypothetical protein [Acetobacterium wieringae]|uniref:Uncharacterized protein n=1 Tax=Acetobacterium wieringae TaxID=52694 RepID=A0A1F2PDR6_9FIRM|nr:hypothetical protein [Acetobacterium wieringae]OFV69134.1 hypothetical protein ACWI_33280 [Acetobacterium wieringae]